MPSLIPATLDITLDAFRAKILAELGTVGIPNLHWPLPTGQDCLAFLTWAAGIRDRGDLTTALIGIGAFRASTSWQQVGPGEVRAGDWALCNWDANPDADHIEFVYSIDRTHGEITDVSANTGPHPGDDIDAHPELRGIYRKTRDIGPWLIGGIRPPYAAPAVTSSERKTIATAATYLNRIEPATYHDTATGRTLTLHRTGTGNIGAAKGDGIRGPLYRLLVQVWGRTHDRHGRSVPPAAALYGETYKLDGIFGPRSTYVEECLFAVAKAAR